MHAATDYNGSIDTIVDEDWYVLYSPGVQQVIVTLESNVAGGPTGPWQEADVIRPDGSRDAPKWFNTNYPQTLYLAVTQGRYYIEIHGPYEKADELGPYRLRLVPSDRFVNQAYLDAIGRLGPAHNALKMAASVVSKDRAAIQTDKAHLRHNKQFSKTRRAWNRKLTNDQRKLASDLRRLKAAQAALRSIQATINANSPV